MNGDVGMTYATQMGAMDIIAKGRYNYEAYNMSNRSGNAWNLAVADVPQLETGADKSVGSYNQKVNSDGFSGGAQMDLLDRYDFQNCLLNF